MTPREATRPSFEPQLRFAGKATSVPIVNGAAWPWVPMDIVKPRDAASPANFLDVGRRRDQRARYRDSIQDHTLSRPNVKAVLSNIRWQ